MQSQLLQRLRQEDQKFKAFLGSGELKASWRNSRRPHLTLKKWIEGWGAAY